ncbi:hypothetical protein [Pseudomonas sp. SWRI179]|uniref:hypothetical protein n=1 Tax=Pseudomonas sp. SWRI179 TaxID=2745497 RepID=UPI001EE33543|nr:hypothetical protein [Pseudomonas sp. SWRI179]
MIKNLITHDMPLEDLAAKIKNLDMTAEINQLITELHTPVQPATKHTRNAAILNMTNPHTATITLYRTNIGNISIKKIQAMPSRLYSVPGKSILFSLNRQPIKIHSYHLRNDELEKGKTIIIDDQHPSIIDGHRALFDYSLINREPCGALVGSINFPDRLLDIQVFDRTTLRKVAWLPHDESAARYLVSLELLETIHDPRGIKVAEELIYHYHPAVAWKAFQMLYRADPQKSRAYTPLLEKRQDTRLNNLLRSVETVA